MNENTIDEIRTILYDMEVNFYKTIQLTGVYDQGLVQQTICLSNRLFSSSSFKQIRMVPLLLIFD